MKYRDCEHNDVPHIVVERITRVTYVDVYRNKDTKKLERKKYLVNEQVTATETTYVKAPDEPETLEHNEYLTDN